MNMLLSGLKVGFALTGSFCTFSKVMPVLESIVREGADVFPIISPAVDQFDTRFGTAESWKSKIREVTGKDIWYTIQDVEPIGPKALLDVLVVAPCTGNTLAKVSNAITDTSVTMACKAHIRNNRPLVLSISTNDGLAANAKNIGMLLNMKNLFLVPFGQDNPHSKPGSLVADNELIIPTILEAMKGKQIQPILLKG